MDAVIYLRVSTKEQAAKDETSEGYSIPAQREACLGHIAERGWSLAGEFTDAGESARTADRPMLKELLRRVAEGGVGAVVVHKIDRRARPRDPVKVLVRQPEPEPERWKAHGLRDLVPRFRRVLLRVGGREGTAEPRLGLPPRACDRPARQVPR